MKLNQGADAAKIQDTTGFLFGLGSSIAEPQTSDFFHEPATPSSDKAKNSLDSSKSVWYIYIYIKSPKRLV